MKASRLLGGEDGHSLYNLFGIKEALKHLALERGIL